MNSSNSYEEDYKSITFGKVIRENIFQLTQKAIELCNITNKDQVLTLSYGVSDTMGYLYDTYNIQAVGMDYSKRRKGKAKEKGSPKDMGEELPFEASCFHCVISEFTLSMVSSLNTRLEEIKRVLKKNGCFAIADIFSKSSTVLPDTEGEEDFITGILSLEEVQKSLAYAGFKNVYMGEYSDLLNNSLANIENKNSLTDKAGLFVLIAFKEE